MAEAEVRDACSLAELQETVAELVEQRAALSEVRRAIAASPHELQPIFDTILQSAARLGRVVGCGLRLREGDRLRSVAKKGTPDLLARWSPPEQLDLESYEGVAGTGKIPVQIPDLAAHDAYRRGDCYVTGLVNAGQRTLLFVPMLKDDKLVGLIILARSEVQPFTDRQIALCVEFAAQATIALETTRRERQYREMQSELSHANRVSAVGQLSASIAHEINQPLTAATINGAVGLRWLRAEPPDIEQAGRSVDRMIRDVTRASDIMRRLSDLTKKQSPQKEVLDVNAAILEVTALARSEAVKSGVMVRTRLASQLPRIEGDRIQLQQVMLNLIVNAIQAMSGEDDARRDLEINTETVEARGVLVSVRDSGPGLSEEALPQLFEPFYTTKPDGMGMGLSICRSIIEAHGGRLCASANEPKGALFQFTIPAG